MRWMMRQQQLPGLEAAAVRGLCRAARCQADTRAYAPQPSVMFPATVPSRIPSNLQPLSLRLPLPSPLQHSDGVFICTGSCIVSKCRFKFQE